MEVKKLNDNHILEVSNLSKSYKDKKILKDISFNFNSGDIFGFLGPNGAGKTTTSFYARTYLIV